MPLIRITFRCPTCRRLHTPLTPVTTAQFNSLPPATSDYTNDEAARFSVLTMAQRLTGYRTPCYRCANPPQPTTPTTTPTTEPTPTPNDDAFPSEPVDNSTNYHHYAPDSPF